MASKLVLHLLLLGATIAVVSAQSKSYEESCDVGKTIDGRELDNCDASKYLKCHSTRCACSDPGNQIWQRKSVKINNRRRRSPKKGGKGGGGFGKSVAGGVAGGVVGGYLGGKLAQNTGSSSGFGGSSSGSRSRDNNKYKVVEACYTRVGGMCILDQYKNSVVVIAGTTPAASNPTTAAPAAAVASNETTAAAVSTSAPPTAAAQVSYQVPVYPDCVQFAECKRPEVKIVNGTVVGNVSSDQRIGNCACQDGYIADQRGICNKARRSSASGISMGWSPVSVAMSVLMAVYCMV